MICTDALQLFLLTPAVICVFFFLSLAVRPSHDILHKMKPVMAPWGKPYLPLWYPPKKNNKVAAEEGSKTA